jgi:hypothetical protein
VEWIVAAIIVVGIWIIVGALRFRAAMRGKPDKTDEQR